MLTAITLCLASLAQAPAERSAVVSGTVVERGTGRPLAGISIRANHELGRAVLDVPAVVTDARGRFEDVPVPGGIGHGDDRPGPDLLLRAEDDRVWPWKPNLGRIPSGLRPDLVVEAVYDRKVQSRWNGAGPGARLIVESPPVGVVEAVVRDPDGRPLTDAPIVLVSEAGPFQLAIRFSGRTDHAGAFRIRSFAGFGAFGVSAPGVGFGASGRFEVVAGATVRPEIPPLARFARIEGRLDDPLTGPGAEACLNHPFGSEDPSLPSAPCDAEGRFAIEGVSPGDYRIAIRRDGRPVPDVSADVRVGAGWVVRDVVVASNPPPADEERATRPNAGDPGRIATWIEGTIRDEEGRPIADATVHVYATNSTSFPTPPPDVRKTVTDREGRYRVEGPSDGATEVVSVLVSAKDRPPIVAFSPGPEAAADPSGWKPARLDVAMGAKGGGGSLRVAVVRRGRKVAGAFVRLAPASEARLFGDSDPLLARPAPLAAAEIVAMKGLIAPRAVADSDGVARFDDLTPDVYEAIATLPVDPDQPADPLTPFRDRPDGRASGIEVPPGGRVETTIAVVDAPAPTRFRLLDPDGAPAADRAISITTSRPDRSGTSPDKTDGRGEGGFELPVLGLWTARLRYQIPEPRSFFEQEEPLFQAEAVLPASPAVAFAEPLVLRAVRREPGAVKVRILDLDGAPARGCVRLIQLGGWRQPRAGSVDDQGWVRFAGAPSGDYRLSGTVYDAHLAPRPRRGPRRLDDEELTNQSMVFDRDVTVEPGGETVAELRMERAGYVRATLRAPAGRSPSEYAVSLVVDERTRESVASEPSADAAERLFGPVPPGRWPIQVWEEDAVYPRWNETVVVAEPGRIARVVLDAPSGRGWPLATAGGLRTLALDRRKVGVFGSGPDDAAISVVTADGAAPAFGARALFIPADGFGPTLSGTADAFGRLTWTVLPQVGWKKEGMPAPADESTVVAWIPGLVGPTVATVDPGEPLRMTLPAPAALAGRVTLGGHPAAGRDARIRIVLAPEGGGAVDFAMRRETTADADGRFRFVGIASGRYVVQAARDEVWTSKPVPLTFEPGKDATVDLDVPAPGATIALELADRQGGPIAAAFSIKDRGGPLAGLATIAGRTDDRGATVVGGLAAGVHELVVDGSEAPIALDVPPFNPGAGPLGVRVEVSRRGP